MDKIVFEESQQSGERYITKQGASAVTIIYHGQWEHRWKAFKFRMLLGLQRKSRWPVVWPCMNKNLWEGKNTGNNQKMMGQ